MTDLKACSKLTFVPPSGPRMPHNPLAHQRTTPLTKSLTTHLLCRPSRDAQPHDSQRCYCFARLVHFGHCTQMATYLVTQSRLTSMLTFWLSFHLWRSYVGLFLQRVSSERKARYWLLCCTVPRITQVSMKRYARYLTTRSRHTVHPERAWKPFKP